MLKLYGNPGIAFCPELAITRPEVAAWIGQCITCWSWVETQMSRMFTLLLQVNIEAGIELYNGLGGAGLKNNGLKILARSRLEKSDYKLIDSLLTEVRSHQKTRDKIAHWYWGTSDQIDDGLVLIDPKDIFINEAKIADKNNNGVRLSNDDFKYQNSKIYVYRVKDLESDAKSFIDLAHLVNKCHGLCVLKGQHLVQLRDELSKDGRLVDR